MAYDPVGLDPAILAAIQARQGNRGAYVGFEGQLPRPDGPVDIGINYAPQYQPLHPRVQATQQAMDIMGALLRRTKGSRLHNRRVL